MRAVHRARWYGGLAVWGEGERLLAESGDVDHVVVNHGVWLEAAIDAMTERQFDDTMNANVRGVFSVCGAATRRMKPRGRGSMVLIASTAGQRGEALHAHYAASKGAVISMTKSLAVELAPFGIRVNCVAPGWVATGMAAPALEVPAERTKCSGPSRSDVSAHLKRSRRPWSSCAARVRPSSRAGRSST